MKRVRCFGSSVQEPLEIVLVLGERTSRRANGIEDESLRASGGSGGSSANIGGAHFLLVCAVEVGGEVTADNRISVVAGERGMRDGESGISGGDRR